MRSYDPLETLINILQSTSFLLQHYGNSVHEPTLSELEQLIAVAVTQLKAQAHANSKGLNATEFNELRSPLQLH
jgi:hypothetical protein